MAGSFARIGNDAFRNVGNRSSTLKDASRNLEMGLAFFCGRSEPSEWLGKPDSCLEITNRMAHRIVNRMGNKLEDKIANKIKKNSKPTSNQNSKRNRQYLFLYKCTLYYNVSLSV